ncbi:hypothetical protein HDU83_005775 [Entophlyctis luteolus]|nr:hypothetical protein HDU83_005775 [Entophlyctis luteolus]
MPGVVDAFTKAGFDVLCYDLYGRGYSASPPIRYDADAYTAQLKNLLDAVGWETASILGYSLGGGIATHFTAIHPERVEDLVLVAPAGLRPKPPLAAKLITTPVLGPLFAYTIGRRVLVAVSSTRKHPKDVVNLPHMQHFIAVQNLNKLYHPGFMRAYVSTVKYGPIHGMAPFYARVAGSHCERVFCTWGRDDRVLSFRHDARVFRAMHPRATFVEMPGGHSVLVERTAEVVAPIVSFLNRRRVDGE